MTKYRVEMDLVCPTNWKAGDVRKFVEKFTTGEEEVNSIKITSVPDIEESKPSTLISNLQLEYRGELHESIIEATRKAMNVVGTMLSKYGSVRWGLHHNGKLVG